MEYQAGKLIAYTLTGALIGAAAALLFAPQSGDETRQWLAQQAKRGRGKFRGATEQARDYAQQGARRAGEMMEAGADRAQEMAEEAARASRELGRDIGGRAA